MWLAVCQPQTRNPGQCVSGIIAKHRPMPPLSPEHKQQADQDYQERLSCSLPLLLRPPSPYPGERWVGKKSSRRGNKEVNPSHLLTVGFSTWNNTKKARRVVWILRKFGLVILITEIRLFLWLEVTRVYFFNLIVSGKAKGMCPRFHPDAGKELAQRVGLTGRGRTLVVFYRVLLFNKPLPLI